MIDPALHCQSFPEPTQPTRRVSVQANLEIYPRLSAAARAGTKVGLRTLWVGGLGTP
jgi:hypothetical protein